MRPEDVHGIIEMKDVSFSYPTKKDVLVAKKINLRVEKN